MNSNHSRWGYFSKHPNFHRCRSLRRCAESPFVKLLFCGRLKLHEKEKKKKVLSVGLKIGNPLNSSGRWTPALQERCRASGGCCCLCRRNKPGAFPQKFREISPVQCGMSYWGFAAGKPLFLSWELEQQSRQIGEDLGKKRHSGSIFLSINLWRDWDSSVWSQEQRDGRQCLQGEGISNWKVSVKILKIPIFSESWCRGGCTLSLFPAEEFNTELFWIRLINFGFAAAFHELSCGMWGCRRSWV